MASGSLRQKVSDSPVKPKKGGKCMYEKACFGKYVVSFDNYLHSGVNKYNSEKYQPNQLI
jgi:hypothetical protein